LLRRKQFEFEQLFVWFQRKFVFEQLLVKRFLIE